MEAIADKRVENRLLSADEVADRLGVLPSRVDEAGRRPANRSRVMEQYAPRLALSIMEAAEAIGVSQAHFKRHVLPAVRVTLSGRRRLVSVRELERYLSERAV
jgi:hypothetical protein